MMVERTANLSSAPSVCVINHQTTFFIFIILLGDNLTQVPAQTLRGNSVDATHQASNFGCGQTPIRTHPDPLVLFRC